MGLSTSSSSDDIKYKNLINWYKGYSIPDLLTYVDVSTGTVGERKTIGAPLHSQPVLINYGFLSSATSAQISNPDYQKNYVFFSTITGTLHGFDARSGAEVFNFIPGEKLNTLEVDHYCYFFDIEKNKLPIIEIPSIKKYIYKLYQFITNF